MKIVLIGAPACGKGTQSQLICEKYSIPHISTGDMFRDAMREQTKLGEIVKKYLDKKILVPDEITLAVVKNRILKDDCKNGYLLDGFPRTINQAIEFSKVCEIDCAVYIETKFNSLIKRIENRLVCPNCKKIFVKGVYNNSICDVCSTKLVKRADDSLDVLKQRFEEFEKLTYPVIDYYKKCGKLKMINGEGTIEDTFKLINEILRSVKI